MERDMPWSDIFRTIIIWKVLKIPYYVICHYTSYLKMHEYKSNEIEVFEPTYKIADHEIREMLSLFGLNENDKYS